MTDGRLAIFTICSNNYLPMADVLLASVRAHCPQADLYICLADRPLAGGGLHAGGGATIVPIEDLAIPDLPGFTFRYDVMELNTAAKPFMFLHLLERRGYARVLYFDPDIEIHAPLGAILRPLEEGACLALTPHLLRPEEGEEDPNDLSVLRAGTYNLGFLGASGSRETLDVLHWWARRLTYQCINDQPAGLFVDQKFIDLVPGFLGNIAILRDPGLNVAYWNLTQRELDHDGTAYRVDCETPLVFFHFSGFDPRAPGRLSKYTPRFHATLQGALARITGEYASRVLSNGFGTVPDQAYAFGRFASGTPIPGVVRRMFRECYPAWPADPFGTFEAHLHQPWPGVEIIASSGAVTNLMAYLHRNSPHLRACADLGSAPGQDLLIDWFSNHAARELALDHRIINPDNRFTGAAPPPLEPAAGPPADKGEARTAAAHEQHDTARMPRMTDRFVSYSINGEDIILHRIFGAQPAGFYVDAGAAHPTLDNDTRNLYDRGWHGINIEPNESYHAKLVAERKRDLNLNAALAEQEGVLSYWLIEDTGLSTCDPQEAARARQKGRTLHERRIKATTLARVLADAAPDSIDLLKVDVEGLELRVLQGNNWTRFRPKLLIIEATLPETPERRPDHVRPFLEQNGYAFAYFDGLNDYFLERGFTPPEDCFRPISVFDRADRYELVRLRELAHNPAGDSNDGETRTQPQRSQQAILACEERAKRDRAQAAQFLHQLGQVGERLTRMQQERAEAAALAQDLQTHVAALQAGLAECVRVRGERDEALAQLAGLQASTSWRSTRHLRRAVHLWRKLGTAARAKSGR